MRGESSWKSLCHWKMISLSKTKRKLVKMLTYRETCLQWTPLIYKMNTLYYWTHWCQTVSHFSPHPYFLYNMNLIHVCVSSAHVYWVDSLQARSQVCLCWIHWMGLTVLIFYTSRVERDSRMQGCHLGAWEHRFSPATQIMTPSYFHRKQKENRTKNLPRCSIASL